MKTKLLFLAMAFVLPFFTNAAVITVSNNPNSPGQYTDLQTAIDAAAPNDILYVHGSATNYGTVIITKPLSLIGGGTLPQTNFQLPTSITSITFKHNLTGTSSGSGSSVSGCDVGNIIFLSFTLETTTYGISNMAFKRNKIGNFSFPPGANAGSYNNYIFQNNIISSIGPISTTGKINLSNALIKNNIINSIYYIEPLSGGNNLIINNIITTDLNGNKGCLFTNNIFLGSNANYNINNVFTKNIFYIPDSTTGFDQATFEASQNTFSGNLYNQDPLFINMSTPGMLSQYSYNYPDTAPFINYNLTSSSPGKNYGTDGTDVGIYGGATPYVEGTTTDSRFRYFPQPAIPQMIAMSILNANIPQNGTLNVNFTAKKNN